MPSLLAERAMKGAAGGGGWCGAVGRATARALRRWQVDQAARAGDGVVAQHDPAGRAQRAAAELYTGAASGRVGAVREEIHRLLGEDPKLPGVRVRELLEPLECT